MGLRMRTPSSADPCVAPTRGQTPSLSHISWQKSVADLLSEHTWSAAVDLWRQDNQARPHRSLDMATPALGRSHVGWR